MFLCETLSYQGRGEVFMANLLLAKTLKDWHDFDNWDNITGTNGIRPCISLESPKDCYILIYCKICRKELAYVIWKQRSPKVVCGKLEPQESGCEGPVWVLRPETRVLMEKVQVWKPQAQDPSKAYVLVQVWSPKRPMSQLQPSGGRGPPPS